MNQIKYEQYHDLAILLLRIGVGVVFILAGWGKLTGIGGVQDFFAGVGIPIPAVTAWIVGFVEFVGGLMVLTGTYIRIPTPLLAIIMLVAIIAVKSSQGFGAARIDLMLLLMNSALFILGSGKYSVDAKLGAAQEQKKNVAA